MSKTETKRTDEPPSPKRQFCTKISLAEWQTEAALVTQTELYQLGVVAGKQRSDNNQSRVSKCGAKIQSCYISSLQVMACFLCFSPLLLLVPLWRVFCYFQTPNGIQKLGMSTAVPLVCVMFQ